MRRILLAVLLLASTMYGQQVGGGITQPTLGSGSAVGGDLGGTLPNPTVVSVAHVTTGLLPISNQVTNPSILFHLNSNSTFAGTPDGTTQKPYTTFASAFAAMTNAVAYGLSCDDGSAHSENISTGPAAPLSITLYGQQCTLVDGSALTFSQPVYDYGLGFTGTLTGTSGAFPSIIEGVVFNG